MSLPVEPRTPGLMVRLMRVVIPFVFWIGRLLRRPPKPPRGVSPHVYGSHDDERLEYIAARAGAPERAAVVYIHGGGWIGGRKESYTRFLSFLAEAGYPVFNIEYPLAPEHPHPGILRSLFQALDWIRDKHPEIGGYHVVGDSAGGNLAMMVGLLATNPPLLAHVDPLRSELPLRCHSVVSLYGVLDRLSWIEDGFPGAETMLESYGGRAAFEAEVGPELAITPNDLSFDAAPPTLLAAGTKDELCRSSQIFAQRLAAGPGKVVHKEYPGEAHGFFNFGRSRHDAELRADMLAFLEAEDPHAA